MTFARKFYTVMANCMLLSTVMVSKIWSEDGQAFNPENTESTVTHGGGNNLLWVTSVPVEQGCMKQYMAS